MPREPGWVDSPGKFGLQSSISAISSVLSEIRHPGVPELGKLSTSLDQIRLYREFKTGPGSQARTGIGSNAASDHLFEDGGNLALRMGEIDLHQGLAAINQILSGFFERFSEVKVLTRHGVTQLYVNEVGVDKPFSAMSLSDGTLRLLCLLVVLLDPEPPPLVCIEEPEAGLHPDAIREVARLLLAASNRMQLVVTTHSTALIDALSDQPDAVLVCERDFDGFTQCKRLDPANLEEWLDSSSLGELWQKGEIGGNRW